MAMQSCWYREKSKQGNNLPVLGAWKMGNFLQFSQDHVVYETSPITTGVVSVAIVVDDETGRTVITDADLVSFNVDAPSNDVIPSRSRIAVI